MFDGLRSFLTGQRDPHRAIERAAPAPCLESADCRCERCAHGLIVSRRWFLGAAGLAIAAPALLEPAFQSRPIGAMLPPGWKASNDGVGLYTISHPMTAAEFREVIRDALEASFRDVYAGYVPPFSNDSLEQLEIDVRRV